MTTIKSILAAAALAVAFATGAVAADSTTATTPPATTAPKPAKAPKVAKVAKPKSEASIACSKDADAKGLHGAARKTFRKACMKGKPKT